MDPSLTEVFRFPLIASNEEQPDWVEDFEFRYKGEMYDVIEKTIEDGQLVVRCLNDKKEKELIESYKDLVKKDFGDRSKRKASIFLKIISNSYTLPIVDLIPYFKGTGLPLVNRPNQSPVLTVSEVLTPPPQG